MLDPREVMTIERVIELLKRREKDSDIRYLNKIEGGIWILEGLLNDTEEAIIDSEPENVMAIIPRVLAKLKKEYDYGTPEKRNISTKSVQRNKNGTINHRREWDTDKQTECNEQTA